MWNDEFRVAKEPELNLKAEFLKFYFKFIVVPQVQFHDMFDSNKQSNWLKSSLRSVGKM